MSLNESSKSATHLPDGRERRRMKGAIVSFRPTGTRLIVTKDGECPGKTCQVFMDIPMGGEQRASQLDDFERWATVGELRKYKIEPEDGMWPPEGDRKPLKIMLVAGGYWDPLVHEVMNWQETLPIVKMSDGKNGLTDIFGPVMSKDWRPFDPRPQWVRITDRAGLNPPSVRRVISWNPDTVTLPRFSRDGTVVGDILVSRKDVEPSLPKWAKIIDMALPLPPTLTHGKVYEIVRWTEIGEPVIKTGEKKECTLSRLCHVRDENDYLAWVPVDELVDASNKVLIPSVDPRAKVDTKAKPLADDKFMVYAKASDAEAPKKRLVRVIGPSNAENLIVGKLYEVAAEFTSSPGSVMVKHEGGKDWYLFPKKDISTWGKDFRHPIYTTEDDQEIYVKITGPVAAYHVQVGKIYKVEDWYLENNGSYSPTISGPRIINDSGDKWKLYPPEETGAVRPGWELSTKEEFEKQEAPKVGAFDPDTYVFQKGDVIEVPSGATTGKPYVAILVEFVNKTSIDKVWMLQYPGSIPANRFDSWGKFWPTGVKLLRRATKEELITCGLEKEPEVKTVAVSATVYKASPIGESEKPKPAVPQFGDCVSISRPAKSNEERCFLDLDWNGNGKAEVGMIVFPSPKVDVQPGEVIIKPIFSSDPNFEMRVKLDRLKKAEERPIFDVVDGEAVVRCSKNPYNMFGRMYGIVEFEKGATSHLNGMTGEMIHWVAKTKGIWISSKMIGFPAGFWPKRWCAVTQAFAISDRNRFGCLRDQAGSMQFHIPTSEWVLMTSSDQEKFWGKNSRNRPIEGYIRDLDVSPKNVRWPTPQEQEEYGLFKI